MVGARRLDGKVLREFTSTNGPNGALGATNWTWNKDYIWRDDLLLATRQPIPGSSNISTYSYHLDHLGTPRLITDANGYAVGIHDYHPFGAEAAGGANEPSLSVMKFTGPRAGSRRRSA